MNYPTRKDRRRYPYHRSLDPSCKRGTCPACNRTKRLRRKLIEVEVTELTEDFNEEKKQPRNT